MKSILVLTDFSAAVPYAAEFAMQIAIKCNARIILCHVMKPSPNVFKNTYLNGLIPDQQVVQNESILNLRALTERLRSVADEFENVSSTPVIQYISVSGFLEDVADKVIYEKSIDLVVIGTHTSRSLASVLFGSQIHSIIHRTACPILIIPENKPYNGVGTITYATDHEGVGNVSDYLFDIAKSFNATVENMSLSSVLSPSNGTEQVLAYALSEPVTQQAPTIYYTAKLNRSKTFAIASETSNKLDILTLVHKKNGFFENHPSNISHQLADNPGVALLILPNATGSYCQN